MIEWRPREAFEVERRKVTPFHNDKANVPLRTAYVEPEL